MSPSHLARAASAVLLATAAHAQHAGDVLLRVEDNRITTNLINKDTGTITPDVRVFGAEFGEIAPDFTDEPGFDTEEGTFTPGSGNGFNILRALRRWNGVEFSMIPAERISVGFGPAAPVLTPLADVFTPGFTLPVDTGGNWHNHLEYTLQSPASTGVYLLEMNIFSDHPGVEPSLPFWFVFNQNESELVHEQAIEWANDNLVPAPGGAIAALALGGPLVLRRRRD